MKPCTAGSSSLMTVSRKVAKGRSPSGLLVHCQRKLTVSSVSRRGSTKTPPQFPTPKHEALTLLHKITNIVPRVLDLRTPSGSTRPKETSDIWERVLSDAHEDLSAAAERPIKIAVYGLDEWSGSQEFVTALLAYPLSSDKTRSEALLSRWKDISQSKLDILHGADVNSGQSAFQFSSPYLSQFTAPIEIIEHRASHESASALSDILARPEFYEADIPILVSNPLITPLSTILSAQLPSNAIVVLSSSTSQEDVNQIIQREQATASPSRHKPDKRTIQQPHFTAADPKRAARAICTLQGDPNTLSAIENFQYDYVGSRLSAITQTLKEKLDDPKAPLNTVRAKLALARIHDTLSMTFTSIHQLRREVDQAFIDSSNLRERIEQLNARIEGDVFGRQEEGTGANAKEHGDEVGSAIKHAQKEMSQVMGQLTWWRMVSRVDEISSIVAAAVTMTWCHDLEKKLILHTGRLATAQRDLSKSAFTLLSRHPTISSAVLRNSLLQLQSSPHYGLTSGSLTGPLYSRRDQIIEYPTTRLHVAGQRAVMGMTGSIVTGVGISWAGWLGWLLGSGEGLLGFMGMDAGTAVGVGMLSAVAGIRWGVGKWEKAKKRWWQDWERVGKGLDRDLKATLHRTMRQQVVVLADAACNGIEKSFRGREEELAVIGKELEEAQGRLGGIMAKVGTKS
ncbi:unnamed protein product [Cyclocybe aegerita]|uniref:Mmc1 C-terminal domain-containing protein n=1 Tax=Cyclocybe aegerita TaxID=1973307 RepID=A0A8S0WY44_CYCAE|nr:unnamed protein product [Cyclocybe aegerita]